ncbi:MAG: hypothetical protein JXX28_15650 [Deltaproteobacteria bacterium]|nr:hypothetical protein [Deltaproteobacteria bacterium]
MSPLSRLALLGGLTALPTLASAAEYRLLTTADGRRLACEILATEPRGLSVAMPQGEMLVPFSLLRDMVPMDAADYRSQRPWLVYVPTGSAFREPLIEAVRSMKGVTVFGDPDAPSLLSAEQAAEADACGADLPCVVSATDTPEWLWIVSMDEDGGLRALLNHGGVSNGATPTSVAVPDLFRAAGEAMEFTPKAGGAGGVAAHQVKPPPPPKGPSNAHSRVMGRSLIPLPGYPSMAEGDMANAGMAWAVTLPATGLWVSTVLHSTDSLPVAALAGVGGFYAITVVTNQVFGLKSAEGAAGVSVLPTQVGTGAVVAFHTDL